MSNAAAGATARPGEPWVSIVGSSGFAGWLAAHKVGLALTTYQTGKLFLLGLNGAGELAACERTFSRCMGLWSAGESLWMSSHYQIWRFANALRPGVLHEGCDRVYVPRVAYTTGDLDAHDLSVEASGRLVFVNTKFNCLATIAEGDSFTPLWRPPFITDLAPEDRCHLNGLALAEGRVRYATATGTADRAEGWRQQRQDGGVVLDVMSGRTIAAGLSMPHSPRVHGGRLWLLNSGSGHLGSIDLTGGTFRPLTFVAGFLRGLAFVGDHAVVGLSRPRPDRNFGDLPLAENLAQRGEEPWCGLQVIHLATGAQFTRSG